LIGNWKFDICHFRDIIPHLDKNANLCYTIQLANQGYRYMVSFLISKNMLFKPKNNHKYTNIAYNLAMLGAILWQIVIPTTVLADISQNTDKNHVLSQTQADRMFYPYIDKKPSYTINGVITAYTSTKGQTDDDPFTAAWGEQVYDGMIANNCLKHNTAVKIPEYDKNLVLRVSDRMNKKYGCERFDIWLDTTRAEAMKFGVKRLVVEVYYPEIVPVPTQLAMAK